MSDGPIVFFDGVCNLCDGFVRFLINIDKKSKLSFASLQGETAAKKLPPIDTGNLNSVVLLKDGKTFKESSAVLEAFRLIGGPWKLFLVFKIIPSFIRDAIYKFIAKNRYKWFGKKEEVCPMPTPEQRARVLP